MIEPVELSNFFTVFFAAAMVIMTGAQLIAGWAFSAGYILLVWDLLTLGRRENRPALSHETAAGAT